MSLDILYDKDKDRAALYDKTSEVALQCPLFLGVPKYGLDAYEVATDFLQWLPNADLPPTGLARVGYPARDPRSFLAADLKLVWLAWHEAQIDNGGIARRPE